MTNDGIAKGIVDLSLKQSADGMRRMGASEDEIERVVAEASREQSGDPFVRWMRNRMGR